MIGVGHATDYLAECFDAETGGYVQALQPTMVVAKTSPESRLAVFTATDVVVYGDDGSVERFPNTWNQRGYGWD